MANHRQHNCSGSGRWCLWLLLVASLWLVACNHSRPAGAPAPFDRLVCNSSEHQAINAFLLAMASRDIYPRLDAADESDNPMQFRNRFATQYRGLGMDQVTGITRVATSTELAVMSNADCIVVVFRGSQAPEIPDVSNLPQEVNNLSGFQDWLLNFNIWPYQLQAGSPAAVSQGYYQVLQGVYADILEAIQAQQNAANSKGVLLTGHSMGGALAVLTAYRLRMEENIPVRGVYTYGMPRVGNAGFRNRYLSLGIPTFRWAFALDPITLFPPSNRDRQKRISVEQRLGMPGMLSSLRVVEFEHIGNWIKPFGDFDTDCIHAISQYGRGALAMLNTTQRQGLPTVWTEAQGVAAPLEGAAACYF